MAAPAVALGMAAPAVALGMAAPAVALGMAAPAVALGMAAPAVALGMAAPAVALGMTAPAVAPWGWDNKQTGTIFCHRLSITCNIQREFSRQSLAMDDQAIIHMRNGHRPQKLTCGTTHLTAFSVREWARAWKLSDSEAMHIILCHAVAEGLPDTLPDFRAY